METIKFIANENLNQKDVEMQVSIGFNYSSNGWYQIYDTKTKGQDWYAEGRLVMNQISLVSFSGFDGLPICILNKLKELGYNTSQVN
jgi:hypothetical protein